MGSLGAGELLLIFLVALLLFGPGKLPELGRALGKAAKEFRKAETEVREAFSESVKDDRSSQPDPAKEPSRDHGSGPVGGKRDG